MNKDILQLSSRFSEGILHEKPLTDVNDYNLFYRKIAFNRSSDISFISGFISTGLRGSAIVDGNNLASIIPQLEYAKRNLLPLVINTNGRNENGTDNYKAIEQIKSLGFFQLIASTPIEEVYLTLIAHRAAELSLIPGMVISDYQKTESHISIPKDELIQQYLGNADDQIISPTPSQKIIFGNTRRRIPNWYSFELPGFVSSKKNGKESSYEQAAYHKYFEGHLQELIDQAFKELNALTKLEMAPLLSKGKGKSAIITVGGIASYKVERVLNQNKNAQWIQLIQLAPLPIHLLKGELINNDNVLILNPTSQTSHPGISVSDTIKSILSSLKTNIQSVNCSVATSPDDFKNLLNAIPSKTSSIGKFFNIPFLRNSSNYPKQEVLSNEIEKHYPEIKNEALNDLDVSNNPGDEVYTAPLPSHVRKFRDKGPEYTRLSRLYDQVGYFYRHGKSDEVIADPFSAVPMLPAASANLLQPDRKEVPIFNPDNCTGCGDCLIHCPHSALPSIAISSENILKACISRSNSKGRVISKLIPMVKNIGQILDVRLSAENHAKVSDELSLAFDDLVIKMGITGEKLETVKKEFEIVKNELGNFPLSVTETYFKEPELVDKGSGALFSIAVDPYACTGCGICSSVCEDDAFEMVDVDPETQNFTYQNFSMWEDLPDTEGDIIKKFYKDPSYPSLASLMMSRSYYKTVCGSSKSDQHSTFKSILHIIGVAAEAVMQPRIVDEIAKIDGYVSSLTETIHKNLSDAIPDQNLESIAQSLRKTNRRKIRIHDVIDNVEDDSNTKFIDAETLQRKTDLAMELNHLKDILQEGPTGYGRSRYGMVISDNHTLPFVGDYPSNNFTTPITVYNNGSAADLSKGLFYGNLRFVLDHIKLLRRAELEKSNKYDPDVHDKQIAELQWQDLNESEKRLLPPIIIVCRSNQNNRSIQSLMTDDLPIKVIYLEDLNISTDTPKPYVNNLLGRSIKHIGYDTNYIFQGGMGDTELMLKGLMDGIDIVGPALFNLMAVDFKNHDLPEQRSTSFAALAQESRLFPGFTFSNVQQTDTIAASLDLKANRNRLDTWVNEKIILSEDSEIEYFITAADWLFTLKDWKDHFREFSEIEDHIPLNAYLELHPSNRQGKTPSISRLIDGDEKYYSVSKEVVKVCEATMNHWRKLKEMAGMLTEFPDKLAKHVKEELRSEYTQKEIGLRNEYEQKIKDIEDTYKEELRQKLKEKLVFLSKMKRNKVNS